jgi:hypothetical protein
LTRLSLGSKKAVLKIVVLGFGLGDNSPVPQILADRDKANNLSVISDDDLLRYWTLQNDEELKKIVSRPLDELCIDHQNGLSHRSMPGSRALRHVPCHAPSSKYSVPTLLLPAR